MIYPAPAFQPDCAGCHERDYKDGPHKKYGDVKYRVDELKDCSGACHEYTDATLTVIKERENGPEHRPSDREF